MKLVLRIMAGSMPVSEETLLARRLPDGRAGALWRGQVFAVADGVLDIAGPFWLPDECGSPQAPTMISWGFSADEPPLLLVSGNAAARDAVLAALDAAGVQPGAAGPCLADSDAADWFIVVHPDQRELAELALADLPATRTVIAPDPAHLLAAAAEREAALRDALARLRGQVDAAATRLAEQDAARDSQARNHAAAIEALRIAAAAAAPPVPAPPTNPASRGRGHLADEIAAIIAALLPRLRLLRDSQTLIAKSFTDRTALLRALRDLHDAPHEELRSWKMVHGAAGWRERHISNGQDNQGRIYARQVAETVATLIASKQTQERDIDWLSHNA